MSIEMQHSERLTQSIEALHNDDKLRFTDEDDTGFVPGLGCCIAMLSFLFVICALTTACVVISRAANVLGG